MSLSFLTQFKSLTYIFNRLNNSYVSVTNCRETLWAWGVPAPSWILMCMICYNVDNGVILGFWCHWIETVSDLPPPPPPSFHPPFLLFGLFRLQQGEPPSDTNTQLTTRTVEQQPWVSGSWAFSFFFFFSFFFLPSMFLLFVCQNKALSGFTHRVYCERTQYIVRSGHARDRPVCLCWVKKWKLLLRVLASWQTRVGRVA